MKSLTSRSSEYKLSPKLSVPLSIPSPPLSLSLLSIRNQWFRRGFTVTVQELIRATFGDRLSYKIVNYMNKMTTSEQIAEYLESTM